MLELLLTPSGDFESCKVLLTDTIFFGDDGKATVYLKTDRDGRVTSSQLKLTIQDLRMRIPDIVKVKRQEVRSILSALLMMQNEEIAAANRGSNQSQSALPNSNSPESQQASRPGLAKKNRFKKITPLDTSFLPTTQGPVQIVDQAMSFSAAVALSGKQQIEGHTPTLRPLQSQQDLPSSTLSNRQTGDYLAAAGTTDEFYKSN